MRTGSRILSILFLAYWVNTPVFAKVITQAVDYQEGSVKLQGYLVWDDKYSGKRPGVLVVHEWWGLNDYAKQRATQLAELGYVAFALDMYGAGKVTRHPKQAKVWMQEIQQNSQRWVSRASAGLSVLKKQSLVDPERLAAIGYCFGGATVLNMAYAGLDVDVVASFHGALPTPVLSQFNDIKASIFVAHGHADSFVPVDNVTALTAALDEAGADWQLATFSGAKHGFTNPNAGDYGMSALAYNQRADQRSWVMMLNLFDETFK